MFAMTRDARVKVGEPREFRWVGPALSADSVRVDGVARFLRLGEQQVRRPDGSLLTVRHDVFEENVSDLRTGFRAKVYFNLWTDSTGRPLKFASSRTVGLRAGYEDLAELAPMPLASAFPAPAAPWSSRAVQRVARIAKAGSPGVRDTRREVRGAVLPGIAKTGEPLHPSSILPCD